MPPHVEPVGRLWDEADLVISIGSDLDGVQTQNFAHAAAAAAASPINLDPEDATKNYRADVVLERHADEACAALAEVGASAAPTGSPTACTACGPTPAARSTARALRFLDAIRFAVPDDGIVVADMCIPGYWLAGFHTPAHPRKLQIPLGWGTLGYAFPAALGAALAGPRAGRRDRGRRRLPLRARRARDGRPGADPADARDRRRRRLRDAALRPGRQRRRPLRRRPRHARLRARSRARSGSAPQHVDGLEDDFGAALAEHVLDPEPSVLVASTPEPLVPPPNTSPNWYRRKNGA